MNCLSLNAIIGFIVRTFPKVRTFFIPNKNNELELGSFYINTTVNNSGTKCFKDYVMQEEFQVYVNLTCLI